jgi:hypothetical protein
MPDLLILTREANRADRFTTMEALHFHRTNPALDQFNKTVFEKDLVAKPIEVVTCQPVIGLPPN